MGPERDVDALSLLEAQGPVLGTLRRWTGLAKAPAILDILEEELETGQLDKVVIFGVHQAVIEMAAKRLAKFGAVTLYGKTPPAQRQRNIDAFQNDPKCRVFVGNVDAAGTTITLHAASEVAALESAWVPSTNAQAYKRAHRIGQTKPVRVRIFSLADSCDEQVEAVLLRKARELTKIF
jgi:SNF2 family DNA or RNA helicase